LLLGSASLLAWITHVWRRTRRGAGFKAAVGGGWHLPTGGLAAPPPLGAASLLPHAWGLLLRLLIQQVRAPRRQGRLLEGTLRAAFWRKR